MVGAAQTAHLTLGLVDDLRAAMAAAVYEGSWQGVIACNRQNAGGAYPSGDVLASLAKLADVAYANPAALKEVLLLPVQHRRIGESSAGQHSGLYKRLAGALQIRGRKKEGHKSHFSGQEASNA